jgi:sugar lactone lactonase YvrE
MKNTPSPKNRPWLLAPALGLLLPLLVAGPSQGQVYSWSTIAGSTNSGSADGTNGNAQFSYPAGLVVDGAGIVYVTDRGNQTVREVVPVGTNWVVSTLAGSVGAPGSRDGTNSFALFNWPTGIGVDSGGSLYLADLSSFKIRQLSPLGTNWVVKTIAGSGASGTKDGTNSTAQFEGPNGIGVDSNGQMYVADGGGNVIRTVAQSGTNWVVLTIAGWALHGGVADGTNNGARFGYPSGAAPDSSGNVYVTDQTYSTIRKVAPDGTNWIVTTIAGSPGSSGTNDGTNSDSRFNRPGGLAVDSGGNIYVADSWNNAVRKITPSGTNWVVTTIGGLCGTNNYALTDGLGSAARFNYPNGVGLDSRANVYVADYKNNAIRRGIPLPVAQTPVLANGTPTLTWTAAVGQLLQVQYTTDLDPANWTDLGDQFVCTNSTITVPDSVSAAPQRFYRLVVTP